MSAVPDAWDDDWVNSADKKSQGSPAPVVLSKAERKARHAEANKQLWDSADQPERFHFVESKGNIPLKDEFKPAVKVLSRKPAPKIAGREDMTGGMAGMTMEDEDDSEEEARKRNEASLAERQRKAQLEREEKQRKYIEVRERLFGSAGSREPSESPSASLRAAADSESRRGSRRGRGQNAMGSQPVSSTEQSPARSAAPAKQLFDPSYTAKPKSNDAPRPATPKEERPVRMPKGPDSSGRGGFGFAARGAKSGVS